MIHALFKSEQERSTRNPMVAAGSFEDRYGHYDPNTPRPSQVETAYRGTFYKVTNMRARALSDAMRKMRVQRRIDRDRFEPVEVDHPWQLLLENPNPYFSPLYIYRWISLARDTYRAAYFIVERNERRVPVALHPVFPEFGDMRPLPKGDGTVGGYVFQRRYDGEMIRYAVEDIWVFKLPTPKTPYESTSLIEALGLQLDQNLYMDLYGRDYLKEARFPPVVLEMDEDMTSEDQVDFFVEQFASKFLGVGNDKKRVAFLGSGIKARHLNVNPEEVMLPEVKKMVMSEIYQVGDVHEGLVSPDATRANAEAAWRMWHLSFVQPEAEHIASDWTQNAQRSWRMLTNDGQALGRLMVTVPNLVPVDPEQEARVRRQYIETGQRKPSEYRQQDGMSPLAEVDQVFMNQTIAPLSVIESGVDGAPRQPQAEEDSQG
jgi:hypothetical protein